ncbi:lantibiotic dehydratase family protein [Flavobacterium branchiicola]|uniref:Lantibiotic dehydratase family protein n=1 Tax=Flavobacterium branchiicola TaxID=1114875 RepID=A0ABV9PB29_9FLAO|nr:lantibiotic dehydratase family protein [Flavobacterium branchiicola]MBS7254037.1 lantibiotic dehydratase family protein [Flavobacterium branchiicola]
MKPQFKILPFSQYVLRTPLFPVSVYLDLLQNYNCEKAIATYKNPLVREALNLASPELVNELNKWENSKADSFNEKKSALELTLLKYIARIASRCTPFGLFAGCSVGNISSETDILLDLPEKHKRFTQFDMQFWIATLQNIAKRDKAIFNLKYFPNSTIYEFGDFYRYIEYKYVKIKREHSITALRKSDTLKEIILKTNSGLTVTEMISLIAADDTEKEEAEHFILHLIDFQFLVSELDTAITGNNEYDRVLSVLKKISDLKDEYLFLEKVQKQTLALDCTLTPTVSQYQTIKDEIQKKGFEYDAKYLFQTDLDTTTYTNNLSQNILKKVAQAIQFLNGIQSKSQSGNLQEFISAFSKRYESQEIPLTIALDTEAGLGYPIHQDMGDSHEILEEFSFTSKKKEIENQIWTPYDYILEEKLNESLSGNTKKIELSENDFPDFDPDPENIPVTISAMIEIYKDEKVSIESTGNLSAAKLLGRFCNGNPAIHQLAATIIEKEERFYPDKILAEVVHIPQSRTGNILRRPALRNFEITYLANSGVEKENTIHLNDLFLSVRNDKIILRSKKLNKEIIPCLSNAHDYSGNSLPVYHFLCALQEQGIKPVYSFNWGVLESHYSYFPRVEYGGVILSKARWFIVKAELTSLLKSTQLMDSFSNWRLTKNIPRYVNWVNSDNTLLLDFETETGIQLFLKSTQNRNKTILEEFLFTEEPIVKNSNGEGFSNQFILSFYKERV